MKKLVLSLVLILSVEAFACSAYVCREVGKEDGGWRIDMTEKTACTRASGNPHSADYCAQADTTLPITRNRKGATFTSDLTHRYFEVTAENRIGFVNLRIYGDKQSCPTGRSFYRADLFATQHPVAVVRNFSARPVAGEIVCVGAEE